MTDKQTNRHRRKNHFYILIREGIRFVQNVTLPPRFCQMPTFWDPLNPKNGFGERVCLFVDL